MLPTPRCMFPSFKIPPPTNKFQLRQDPGHRDFQLSARPVRPHHRSPGFRKGVPVRQEQLNTNTHPLPYLTRHGQSPAALAAGNRFCVFQREMERMHALRQ
jgi:hypothetical protein